jgi:hypothetical protein
MCGCIGYADSGFGMGSREKVGEFKAWFDGEHYYLF